MTTNKNMPFAKAEMLVRRPVSVVFEAFVNPEITARFWFAKSTGKLATGKHVQWTWEMYNHPETIFVKMIEPKLYLYPAFLVSPFFLQKNLLYAGRNNPRIQTSAEVENAEGNH